MKINLPFITIGSIVALAIFTYMRNRQAARNHERRKRLLQQQEELIERLKCNEPSTEKSNNNDH